MRKIRTSGLKRGRDAFVPPYSTERRNSVVSSRSKSAEIGEICGRKGSFRCKIGVHLRLRSSSQFPVHAHRQLWSLRADSDAIALDDPQLAGTIVPLEHFQESLHKAGDFGDALPGQAQDEQAGIVGGAIGSDV